MKTVKTTHRQTESEVAAAAKMADEHTQQSEHQTNHETNCIDYHKPALC